eukprot:326540_1
MLTLIKPDQTDPASYSYIKLIKLKSNRDQTEKSLPLTCINSEHHMHAAAERFYEFIQWMIMIMIRNYPSKLIKFCSHRNIITSTTVLSSPSDPILCYLQDNGYL